MRFKDEGGFGATIKIPGLTVTEAPPVVNNPNLQQRPTGGALCPLDQAGLNAWINGQLNWGFGSEEDDGTMPGRARAARARIRILGLAHGLAGKRLDISVSPGVGGQRYVVGKDLNDKLLLLASIVIGTKAFDALGEIKFKKLMAETAASFYPDVLEADSIAYRVAQAAAKSAGDPLAVDSLYWEARELFEVSPAECERLDAEAKANANRAHRDVFEKYQADYRAWKNAQAAYAAWAALPASASGGGGLAMAAALAAGGFMVAGPPGAAGGGILGLLMGGGSSAPGKAPPPYVPPEPIPAAEITGAELAKIRGGAAPGVVTQPGGTVWPMDKAIEYCTRTTNPESRTEYQACIFKLTGKR